MNQPKEFQTVHRDEPIAVPLQAQLVLGHEIARAQDIIASLQSPLKEHADLVENYGLEHPVQEWNEERNGWFSEAGVPCKILQFGSHQWCSGRVRLTLEFLPDDVELTESASPTETSPLDDIRQFSDSQ
ncbi:MAG: hypothetical protein MH825_01665 [Cyanobacteria bacterium]|nr:hypothetical protein [Cyanobacteriota bacterium]